MSYLAIMNWDVNNRAWKGQPFPTLVEAQAFAAEGGTLPGTRADAFAALSPGGNINDMIVDPVAKTITYIPIPPVKPTTISYEAFQDRFTAAEFNAATDFVYESDLVTGKPKRRALIQGLSRAMAKNSVNLLDARTVAFLDALVAGGIITAQRKTEILQP